MKKKTILDLFPQRVIDEKAFSLDEISAAKGYGRSQMSRYIREKVASGEIEQVWKHKGRIVVMAYRMK